MKARFGRTAVCAGVVLASCVAVPHAIAEDATCDSWVSATSGDWNDPTMWSAGVPDESTDACITVPGSYTVSLTSDASVNSLVAGTSDGPQPTLSVRASVYVNEDLTNLATVRIASTDPGGGNSLHVGGTLANEGTIQTSQRLGMYATRMSNSGAIRFGGDVRYWLDAGDPSHQDPGYLENFGTVSVAQNASFSVGYPDYWAGPTVFANEPGGTVDIAPAGALNIVNGEFDLNGGSVTGAAVRFTGYYDGNGHNGAAILVDHSDGAAWFQFGHYGTLIGDVAAGQRIDVVADDYNESTLFVSGPATNAGTIHLEDSKLAPKGTLTNIGHVELVSSRTDYDFHPTLYGRIANVGTIDVSTLNGRLIDGVLTNRGAVNIKANSQLIVSDATFRNRFGAITIDIGFLSLSRFVVDHGTFEEGAGVTRYAPVELSNGSELDLTGKGESSFVFTSSGTMSGDIARSQMILIRGGSAADTTVVEAQSGFTNAGRIGFQVLGEGPGAALRWPGGLRNVGSIVAAGEKFQGNLVNSGTLAVYGRVTVAGRFRQTSLGTLVSRVYRRRSGWIAAADGVTLGGALRIDGTPRPDTVYRLIDPTTSVQGIFASVEPPDIDVTYDPDRVTFSRSS